MTAWEDPDLVNHIKGEQDSLNMTLFQDKIMITNNDEIATTDKQFKSKRGQAYNAINIYHPSYIKLFELLEAYRSKIYPVKKDSKYQLRSLHDSFDRYSRTDFSTFLIALNDLFSTNEYQTQIDNNPNLVISNTTITNIFSRIIGTVSYPSVRELNTTDEINDVMKIISESAISANYSISDLISEKTYMSTRDIEKVIHLPIINKYVNKALNIYLNGSTDEDRENLYKGLIDYLNKIKIYVKNDTEEE